MEKRKKTAAEKAWQSAYDKEHFRDFTLRLKKNSDADLIEKLDSVPNKSQYLRGLVRADVDDGNNSDHRFVVIEYTSSGDHIDAFKTLNDANNHAEYLIEKAWLNHRDADIAVGIVTRDDLADGAINNETGEIDWTAFHTYNYAPNGIRTDDANHSRKVEEIDVRYHLGSDFAKNYEGYLTLFPSLNVEKKMILPLWEGVNLDTIYFTGNQDVFIPDNYVGFLVLPNNHGRWQEFSILDADGEPSLRIEGQSIKIYRRPDNAMFIRAFNGSWSD